jgi:MoaA/NifB/PqqE/SkfB family radical SAM enzyme
MNKFRKLQNILIERFSHVYSTIDVGIQDNLVRLSKNLDRPLNRPTSIVINVTSNCMLRCQQCDLWKSVPEKQITFEEAKIVIDKLHAWLGSFYIFFTGGEPFINQDLPKIIKYAESIGLVTHVNSNAFVINDNLAKKIVDSNLSSISISLDGGNAITHDHLRGVQGAYNRVLNGIKLLRKYRTGDHLKIYLNSVIMKPNVAELSDIVKVATDNKVDGMTFQNLLPTLASKKTTDEQFHGPLWPVFSDLQKAIDKVIKNFPKTPVLLTDIPQLKYALEYYKNPHITDSIQCAAGLNNVIVNHQGDVRLCYSYPVIGNILKDDPKTIWYGQKARDQRKIIRRCRQPCKMTACNRINTERQKSVIVKSFERFLYRDLPQTA